MKIRAVAASTFTDKEQGWSYSDSALMDLAKTAKGNPVIYKKKKIGIVESGKYDDSRLIITAIIDLPGEILNEALFLAPGGLTDFATDGDIISECKAHRYVFTDNPSDKTLTVFEHIE